MASSINNVEIHFEGSVEVKEMNTLNSNRRDEYEGHAEGHQSKNDLKFRAFHAKSDGSKNFNF